MSRGELENLLPRSVTSGRSPGEVLQELAVTSAVGGSAGGSNGSSTGTLSGGTLPGVTQGSLEDVNNGLSTLTEQIGNLASVQQSEISATQDNTTALGQSTTTKGSGGESGGTLGGIASSILGSGLSPIISGLISLFGGSSTQNLTAPTPFMLPPAVNYQAGLTGSGQIAPVDSGQTGQPRIQSANSAPQVTVQVNAMDSQSFLDHSDDIANAVKSALLNSHSLSDVIGDL
ncbi:MAG: hypothetical protein ABSE86_03595 [Bryobacteraceae bacterium]|jgi:hypothetical protein